MIYAESTFQDIVSFPILKELKPYFIYTDKGDSAGKIHNDSMTLLELQKREPTWSAADMAFGLNAIIENDKRVESLLLDVYSSQEIKDDTQKESVKLIYFPARQKNTKDAPVVILAAGGGYGAVCSLCEAFPVAARLSELGLSVFCLNYRVGGKSPLFPKPMEDLAAAYRYLKKNESKLQINMDSYAVGGFSAGGHLAACWGTKELGYRKYGFRKPEILLLDYPMISTWRTVDQVPEPYKQMMLEGYLGKSYSQEECKIYNVDEMIDNEYPPVYVIQAEDDTVVPIWNSADLVERLKEFGILFKYEHPETGGHGFGLGTETLAAGWTERAHEFWKTLLT